VRPLLLVLVFALLAPVAQAQSPGGFFTVNGNGLKSSPARDLHMANIARIGVMAVRADALWNVIEPAAGGKRRLIAAVDLRGLPRGRVLVRVRARTSTAGPCARRAATAPAVSVGRPGAPARRRLTPPTSQRRLRHSW